MFASAEPSLVAVRPLAPTSFEETGLSADVVIDLVRKALEGSAGLSGAELMRRVGLPFAAIEPSLDLLRGQLQCEIIGGSMLGGSTFRYRLTDLGQARAVASLERHQYRGIAPVPLAQYRRYMDTFAATPNPAVSPADVRGAFANLVVSEEVLDELGPAINARHSIFIYGPPGNGKSVMARTIQRLLTGTIAVPHAIDIHGQIVRFFDPSIHEALAAAENDDRTHPHYDRRWVVCKRPMVSVGGELTLEALGLAYSQRSGVYCAPVQTLANGGLLIIDDFGRQQCPPRELLNWWMVPLESRVEYMALISGEKVEMPFQALVIFSTNIRPSELVDEAFLRRIRYKIYAGNPTREDFIRIFERCCDAERVAFHRPLVEDLLDRFYRPRQLRLRGCQPRDLIKQALAFASYRGHPRELTPDLLEAACASYFINLDQESCSDTP